MSIVILIFTNISCNHIKSHAIIHMVMYMNRIRELRKSRNMSQKTLAELLHVHQTAVSQWETGRTETDLATLCEMARLFGVSLEYLAGQTEREPISAETPALPSNLLPVRKKPVPILGRIAAGVPLYAEQQYGEYALADEDKPADFALLVEGDSMQPTIQPGDTVFFRAQDDVDDGEIAAVVIEDEATLKHVYHVPGGVQLISENHRYPAMFFTEGVRIIGKAIYYRRDL